MYEKRADDDVTDEQSKDENEQSYICENSITNDTDITGINELEIKY